MPLIIPASQTLAAGGYDIDNSCRFNDDDTAWLKWTPGSAGNLDTWSVSMWVKRSKIGAEQAIFHSRGDASNKMGVSFDNDDTLVFENRPGNGVTLVTTQLFRDTSAWYHLLCVYNSPASTEAERMRVYVNGSEITSFASSTYPSVNTDGYANDTNPHWFGTQAESGAYYDGYLAEVNFTDGIVLTPSDVGESGDYGEWKPKRYSGSHGTNGFYLDFKNAGAVYETGNRSSSITVTYSGATYSAGTPSGVGGDGLVSGTKTGTAANGFYWTNHTPSSAYMRFEFSSSKTITEVKYYSDGTGGSGGAWGVWKWQGSNDASDWTDIGSSFNLGGETPYQTQTSMSANTTAYTYYQLTWVSGSLSAASWHTEIEFGTGTPAANGLGTDASGEDNHFTPTNLAVSDQMTDSPTNNFAVMNTLDNYWSGATYSEGNLKVATGANGSSPASNFGMSSGKWYCEAYCVSDTGNGTIAGITGTLQQATAHEIGHYADGYSMGDAPAGGTVVRNNNGNTSYGSGFGIDPGETIGMAVDLDNNRMYWRNDGGAWVASADPTAPSGGYTISAASATSSGHYHFAVGRWSSAVVTYVLNFGQDGTFAGNETAGGNADDNGYGNFLYDVPAGFLALCSKNLTDCAVTPSEHFNTILYDDGAGAKTGVGFQPDLVWLKSRGSAYEHELTDAVRGVTKALSSDSNSQIETTDSTGLTAFGSDGFTVGADNNYDDTTGDGMVAWCWKAGNATLGTGDFTQGSIASTCSRNADAGFSIVSWTGTGSLGTVGHGLSVAPNYLIVRNRDYVRSWIVCSEQSLASMDFTDALLLDEADAKNDTDGYFNDTAPSATVFTVKDSDNTNRTSDKFIAYCFHNVEGYSKIGAYTGNANRDGTFIYLGFRPAFVMIKNVSSSANWVISDSARDPNNKVSCVSRPDINNADYCGSDAYFAMDFLSNGIKLRENDAWFSNATPYLYIAFAETPFKNSNAR